MLLKCHAKTIHSWSGIGLAHGDNSQIVNKVVSSKPKSQKWRSLKVLIVDEISMMSYKIFDILDQIGKKTRNCSRKPFGGVQVIFCGDFFQLPPIGEGDSQDSDFCFQHPLFDDCFPHKIEFTQILSLIHI